MPIISTLFAFLLGGINQSRSKQNLPPVLPLLEPFCERHPWLFLFGTPVVVTGTLALLIVGLRCVLPAKIRARFVWRRSPEPPPPPREPIEDSRRAITTPLLASIATALLIFLAMHVHADRTRRRPVVTWHGPLADYVLETAIAGWSLSAIAVVLGLYSIHCFRSKWQFLAQLGVILGILNLFGSCLFWGVVYED